MLTAGREMQYIINNEVLFAIRCSGGEHNIEKIYISFCVFCEETFFGGSRVIGLGWRNSI